MTVDEFGALRAGDKIRHMSSSHTLRLVEAPVFDFDHSTVLVEKNYRVFIFDLADWLIVSMPRLTFPLPPGFDP